MQMRIGGSLLCARIRMFPVTTSSARVVYRIAFAETASPFIHYVHARISYAYPPASPKNLQRFTTDDWVAQSFRRRPFALFALFALFMLYAHTASLPSSSLVTTHITISS
ncbi:hypothetical protein FRC19_001067 [Serendipita sp. 401]|nr:hypothetical protein FRC19_001067 [Serendipita sp. 401]KAG9048791.1 hypothetical protein FS842_000310 [Serendipita sp. 407]